MSKDTDNQNESTIPTVSEESNTMGDIRINHSVVASIVRLAALEVSGVAAVGGGFVDGQPRDDDGWQAALPLLRGNPSPPHPPW